MKLFQKTPNFVGMYMFEDISYFRDVKKFFHENSDLCRQGKVLNVSTGESAVIPQVKLSTDMSTNHLPEDLKKKYFKNLEICCDKYKKEYIFSNQVSQWKIVESPLIQYYEKNQGYFEYHMERGNPGCNRHLVFMTYLNTIKNGGETEFYYQKLKVKPKEGLTLIWPSDWTHTHRGITSTTEEKYIITGWYSYF
jgi:prolyl 4-hydroxylase